ncbi:MAG: N-acetylmuramoyl-L-alanine amidase [Roseovarius sp.]|nr:N-acetylmuramoyl-L-alanine amidase [Roseovarius sp.]
MRGITAIVIHCADTPAQMDIGAAEIRAWHTDPPPRGNGWRDIGYHWVIRRDGTVEQGRDESVAGAHVAGHNTHSIGICLVGGKHGADYTRKQWAALDALVQHITGRYPGAKVIGHRDLDQGKQCPQFDAAAWWNHG